jgi:hypothetical protein
MRAAFVIAGLLLLATALYLFALWYEARHAPKIYQPPRPPPRFKAPEGAPRPGLAHH